MKSPNVKPNLKMKEDMLLFSTYNVWFSNKWHRKTVILVPGEEYRIIIWCKPRNSNIERLNVDCLEWTQLTWYERNHSSCVDRTWTFELVPALVRRFRIVWFVTSQSPRQYVYCLSASIFLFRFDNWFMGQIPTLVRWMVCYWRSNFQELSKRVIILAQLLCMVRKSNYLW